MKPDLAHSKVDPTHVLSCDPGLSGAFCLYGIHTRKIQIWDMPLREGRVDPVGVALVVDLARNAAGLNARIHAVVELVQSRPRQSGSFNFGVSAGIFHGVLGALGVPYSLVSPSQWKPAMGLRKLSNETQDQNKSRARELAQKLWPERAYQFKRVKDDGRAEACLLARYFVNKEGW